MYLEITTDVHKSYDRNKLIKRHSVHKDKDKDVFIGPKDCFTHDDDTNKRQAIPPTEINLQSLQSTF